MAITSPMIDGNDLVQEHFVVVQTLVPDFRNGGYRFSFHAERHDVFKELNPSWFQPEDFDQG